MSLPYQAVFIVSFGGPEGMDDVMPFLDNVLRGRNVPHERKLEVAHHYEMFGGVSPLKADKAFRAAEAHYASGWYESITHDTWGSIKAQF